MPIDEPARACFDAFLHRSALDAAHVVYVGDEYVADVVGAREARLTPILVDRGKRLGTADLDDAREMCPVCHSSRPRRPVYRIQRDPDIEMLECATCGAASASHMPEPGVLATYYAQYYSEVSRRYTLDDPLRFARHVFSCDAGLAWINAASHSRFRRR